MLIALKISFLFAPDVWGSVSDWFLVLVTSATAFYLYKTLRSQKEVQKTQTKLFEIESIRFKESIKPKLRYTVSREKFTSVEIDSRMISIEVINETASIALQITPIYSADEKVKPIIIHPNPQHLVKGDKPLFLHFLLKSDAKVPHFIMLSLSYQDVAGTQYKQGVLCIKDSDEIEINTFLPEIINNVSST